MRLTQTFILSATVMFWLCVSALHARAETEGPGTKTVRGANEKVAAMLRQNSKPGSSEERTLVDGATKSLRGFLDIEELGRLAMQDHWTRLSQGERSEYTSLLRKLIETNYVKGLRANLDYRVRYLGEQQRGEYLVVMTVIESERKGRSYSIEVDYLLRKDGDAWRTFDVITDGVGLVENYRAMFNSIMGKSGIDGLLGRMRKKLASL